MKVLANLGKLKDGREVLLLDTTMGDKFVIARNYNPDAPEGEQWDSGTYYHNLDSLAPALTHIEYPIGFYRLDEIASKAIDALIMIMDDMESAIEYLKNEVEFEEDEFIYFGINDYDD